MCWKGALQESDKLHSMELGVQGAAAAQALSRGQQHPNAAKISQHTFAESFSNSMVLIFSAALAVCGRATALPAGMTKAWAQPRVTIAKAQAVFMFIGRKKRTQVWYVCRIWRGTKGKKRKWGGSTPSRTKLCFFANEPTGKRSRRRWKVQWKTTSVEVCRRAAI